MSKHQKALDNVKIAPSFMGGNDEYRRHLDSAAPFLKDIAILQELVDKEKPMKPITTEYFTKRYDAHNSYVFPIYMCSICNESFSDDSPKYCPGCGQKLDWSDENAT